MHMVIEIEGFSEDIAEKGLVVEDSGDESIKVNCQENEVVSSSEGFLNCSDGGSNIPIIESKIPEEDESEVNLANKNHHVDGYGRETDMQKALERQTQLLDQYEAMEKAQRDWEEKFRENSGAIPDPCVLGNHSDMTEETDESKAQFLCSAKVVASNAQDVKAEPTGVFASEEIFKAEVRDNRGGYHNQKRTTFSTSDFLGQGNLHSLLKGNQNESSVNCHCLSSDKHHHHQDPHWHGYPDSRPTDSFSTDVYGGLHQNDASRNENDLYALVSHEQSHKFSGVLESLKQARISLKQELNRLQLVEGRYTGKAIKPSASVSRSEDRFNIPVGCSGLFRLPTDFSDEATARFNVHHSTSGFSTNFYIDRIISRTSGAQFCTDPHSGTMPSLSVDDQSLATGHLESGSRFDSKKPPFDPFLDGGLSSSGKYVYPILPIYPSYQNATPQMPVGDGLSRPYSNSTVGIPLAYNFSFHGDHLRSNMYI